MNCDLVVGVLQSKSTMSGSRRCMRAASRKIPFTSTPLPTVAQTRSLTRNIAAPAGTARSAAETAHTTLSLKRRAAQPTSQRGFRASPKAQCRPVLLLARQPPHWQAESQALSEAESKAPPSRLQHEHSTSSTLRVGAA